MKGAIRAAAAIVIAAIAGISIVVEREAAFSRETMGDSTAARRAVVLFHPSRDAGFSDALAAAIAARLHDDGFFVEQMTVTSQTPADLTSYTFACIVTNTYYATPDWPTLRFLRRARLTAVPTVGIVGGLGSTGRAERVLGDALRAAGADVVAVRSFWIMRPNDEKRMTEPNRQVAAEMAAALAGDAARSATSRSAAGRSRAQ